MYEPPTSDLDILDEATNTRLVSSVRELLATTDLPVRALLYPGRKETYWESIGSFIPGGLPPDNYLDLYKNVPIGETSLFRVKDVYYLPKLGVLVTSRGEVLARTYAEARYKLGPVPTTVALGIDGVCPEKLTSFAEASIFLPWGGFRNYGHYLIDALAGALAIMSERQLDDRPLLAPELTSWQFKLIQLLQGARACHEVHQCTDEVIYIKDAIYTNTMDHFLHSPNKLIKEVRNKIIESSQKRVATETSHPRVYISRRNQSKRSLINEDELIFHLERLGFLICFPESLTIEQQVSLFRGASIVVASSGAGLANSMFMAPGSVVVEIQPSLARNVWVRNLCHHCNLRWRPYFVDAVRSGPATVIGGRPREDIGIIYSVDARSFLRYLDEQLVTYKVP